MSQRRAARHLAGNAGEVNVSQALFFMTNVPFLFQHAKLRPHRRIIWFVGQFGKHFSYRGAFELVKMKSQGKPHTLSRRERQMMDILYQLERATVGKVLAKLAGKAK